MITFTEYLEEAYSADMKKLIPADKLQEIGNYFAKNFNISVQDSDFIPVKKSWKKSDIESHRYAIWLFKDETVAISNSYFSTGEHTFAYPKSYDGKKLTTTIKKDVKNVWCVDDFSDEEESDYIEKNDVFYKRLNRKSNKKTNDKIDAIQHKVDKLSPTRPYKQLETLAVNAGLKLEAAHLRLDGSPYVSIYSIPNSAIGKKGFNVRFEYNKDWNIKIYCDSNCKHLNEYSKFVDDMNKLYAEMKKIDLAQLPKYFV
jgi:hypothetical protein